LIETIGVIAGSGWASGLNLYLTTLMLGVAGRAGWADIPDVLTRTDVMIVAGVLFAVEFVADKVPFLDSFWDVIHTFIRPVGAAAIGAVIAGSRRASERPWVGSSPEPSPSTPTRRRRAHG
jgi:hypothetical protein